MPVFKRKYRSGKVVWRYLFDAPGSTRQNRRQIEEGGFATKREAEGAEARRRIEEQQKYELAKLEAAKAATAAQSRLPQTLDDLLKEFFKIHSEKKLAPKTDERYQEQAAYLSPELLSMPISDITPLHLTREWDRLLERGGRHRKTKEPRPLSKKTVRNIAGVVSSAFTRAKKWGLVKCNPVFDSDPPQPDKRKGIALAPAQTSLLLEASEMHWLLPVFLELADAGGARRGEILALRWSDIRNGGIMIERSLCQTKKNGLFFKLPKNKKERFVPLPDAALQALETIGRSRTNSESNSVRTTGATWTSSSPIRMVLR
jgi:integrase